MSVGFIGAGRMAQALSRGLINSGLIKPSHIILSSPSGGKGLIKPSHIIASDIYDGTLSEIKRLGVQITTSNKEVVQKSNVVYIAVKPNTVEQVLTDVHSAVSRNHLFVSIAAGITIDTLEKLLPSGTRVIRVMPNTPALVLCGASVYALGNNVQPGDGDLVASLLSSVGICEQGKESQIDAVTGLSGSGPAYIYVAIEAMADGGVKMGLSREMALKLAAQTVMGAAKMVLESGKHPGELKDMVCSPAGTTISAITQLEKHAYRSALIDAVEAATIRSRELGQKK